MGANTSSITQEQLEEYIELTYLNKSEIISLFNRFKELTDGEEIFKRRVHVDYIFHILPQMKCNPFCDRICWVFSSEKDNRFSFEDLLDFCSVMSEKCPKNVKALWAFRIFDFNDDRALDKDDLKIIIDRLTGNLEYQNISDAKKDKIIDILLNSMDIEKNGSIGPLEFEHAIGKMSDFAGAFTFRL